MSLGDVGDVNVPHMRENMSPNVPQTVFCLLARVSQETVVFCVFAVRFLFMLVIAFYSIRWGTFGGRGGHFCPPPLTINENDGFKVFRTMEGVIKCVLITTS